MALLHFLDIDEDSLKFGPAALPNFKNGIYHGNHGYQVFLPGSSLMIYVA